ncbi:phosphatidylinositol 4-phosphate 5-kinase-like protein 1 isoform X2 [Pipistrellus kuhlii]|uniref:phosphatidylinositol 4-phosphate 5-kinase-like protein 1 isoform X2 n=1 Tax=Pipistrellus kuhlii TaxID=59472 RepID=UPI001E2703BF|nr:phosphatidylinositol 4-phosphate 5-kinase-like protein 1 isoform X2 [Pipistrellus kuhlii]
MAAPSPGPREVLAASPEAGCKAVASRSGRRGLLWRLRDKQLRLGLFEISPGHELHRLTCMMQAGLWAATQVSVDHPPRGLPTEEDFSEVLTQVHKGFELGTLAGPAFAWLRHSLGLAEEDYQATLGPGGPYLQFLSTSKSSASFFLSHDQRFFLKTQRRREVRALLAHLPRYLQHLQRHPHSLLARLLEILHHHAERLLPRRPHRPEGKTIDLGPQRSWLLRQMELDTAFLRDLNLLDYSLLMASQQLQEDERGPGGSLLFRSARSVQGLQSLAEPGAQNLRLLPEGPNALHIVDGPEQRYFLGLVDLATVYGLRKRLEHLWKALRYPNRAFSTVSPALYARRLCQWVEAHTD